MRQCYGFRLELDCADCSWEIEEVRGGFTEEMNTDKEAKSADRWFSKSGPLTSSTRITGNLLEIYILVPHPRSA